jgi:hypothetical protein
VFTEANTKVDLIVLNEALEALSIRSVLEAFGVEVRCHFIGNVKKLVSLFSGAEPLHEIVIISCHGDEQGMILPELHEELEKEMPYHKVLTTSDFAQFLNLQNQIVINTGCCLGSENFAEPFIQKGAFAYIGLETYVEGNAVLFFVISFLYFRLCNNLSVEDAFAKAKSLDDETRLIKLYQRK